MVAESWWHRGWFYENMAQVNVPRTRVVIHEALLYEPAVEARSWLLRALQQHEREQVDAVLRLANGESDRPDHVGVSIYWYELEDATRKYLEWAEGQFGLRVATQDRVGAAIAHLKKRGRLYLRHLNRDAGPIGDFGGASIWEGFHDGAGIDDVDFSESESALESFGSDNKGN
ncbi:MAG: hypothetical protein ACI8W8_002642 [Rhodothermales bacterium]|jgi:hypothetical protein